jgi:hypothetical protein
MKRACFVSLFLCLNTTFLLSQSNPVPLINQSAGVVAPISASQSDPKAQARILDSYGKLPLSFEANQGQTDARVKFLSRGSGYTLFLTSDEAVFSLRGSEANTNASGVSRQLRPSPAVPTTNAVLRMKLHNANRAAKVTGTDQLPGKSNYFIGNDPKKWRSNVPTYAKVKYEGVYSGVDLVYYGNQRQLEYDFIVAPGADPRRIQFDVGAALVTARQGHPQGVPLRIDGNGDLVVATGDGEVRFHRPVVYQPTTDHGQRTTDVVEGKYVLTGAHEVRFQVAAYDRSKPLVIDPTLAYSTYLGGSNLDSGEGIAVDASGNAYVTGETWSTDFPTTSGAFQTTFGGGPVGEPTDAFVSKLNAAGSALLYSTYLGGSGGDFGFGIAVDSSGNAYVTGSTDSSNFPTTSGAFQTIFGGGFADAFVSKLNAAGSALLYSTYLGGNDQEIGYGIAVDASGNGYVAGRTASSNFPTSAGAFQTTIGGGYDAFVSKLNAAGSALLYSTYLGGGGYDDAIGIAVDAFGGAYVTGGTSSSNFPTTPGAFQATYGGGEYDAYVSELNAGGSALLYSTYLGGNDFDYGVGIAVDALGNAYVAGETWSTDFPTTSGAFQTTYGGEEDAFVSKLNAAGSALLYSTYLGGSGIDAGHSIAVGSGGSAYVTGWTTSSNFPTSAGAFQTTFGGGYDAFVSKFSFGIGPPTNKDQCKDGGWKTFTIPRKFKNQGDCVSFVNTGK